MSLSLRGEPIILWLKRSEKINNLLEVISGGGRKSEEWLQEFSRANLFAIFLIFNFTLIRITRQH